MCSRHPIMNSEITVARLITNNISMEKCERKAVAEQSKHSLMNWEVAISRAVIRAECLHTCVTAWLFLCLCWTAVVWAFMEVSLCCVCQQDYKKTNGRNWRLLGWHKVWINHCQGILREPFSFLKQLQELVYHGKVLVCTVCKGKINTSICTTKHFSTLYLTVDHGARGSGAFLLPFPQHKQAVHSYMKIVRMIHINV